MNADEALELARKAYPNDEDLRVAYMLGLNEGYELHKEDMMKEARNHFVLRVLSDNAINKMIELYNDEVDCKFGDVVRIIIVKED